ncbi:MAG: hypothetical protein H6561_21235 [Lewinellaceae bacterium]|nr:hypothetical protein [Lewinellaceae bacterium]
MISRRYNRSEEVRVDDGHLGGNTTGPQRTIAEIIGRGLIPTETTIKIRVDDPYQVAEGTGANSGHPAYMFSFTNVEATQLEQASIPAALRSINVVPNHINGYSPHTRLLSFDHRKIIPAADDWHRDDI